MSEVLSDEQVEMIVQEHGQIKNGYAYNAIKQLAHRIEHDRAAYENYAVKINSFDGEVSYGTIRLPRDWQRQLKLVEEWRGIAYRLFKALDDVDTASDIAKGNDGMYRNLVHRHQQQRFDIVPQDEVVKLYDDFHPESDGGMDRNGDPAVTLGQPKGGFAEGGYSGKVPEGNCGAVGQTSVEMKWSARKAWNGGERPMDGDTKVAVYRIGYKETSIGLAEEFHWNTDENIIAYCEEILPVVKKWKSIFSAVKVGTGEGHQPSSFLRLITPIDDERADYSFYIVITETDGVAEFTIERE